MLFDGIITLRFGALTYKIWNVIVILKLVEKNSKYLIGYLDKIERLLGLILPKMSEYFKTFKVRHGNEDKNNKIMSIHIYDE